MIRTRNLLALGVVLFAANAAAADAKNYPALGCQRLGTVGALVYTGHGAILNNSTTSELQVECPAVQDVLHIAGGFAQVKDRNGATGQDFGCSLTTNWTTGSSFGSNASSDFSAASGDSWQELTFGEVPGSSDSYYVFTCTIPKKTSTGDQSVLAMYSVNEL